MTAHDRIADAWIEEFRLSHEADVRNAAVQPFEEYWRWVKAFLVTGGAGQRGWLTQGDDVLRGVRDTAAAERLRDRLHLLGRAIAAEWAKDGRRRRIHSSPLQGTPNLYDWGRRLQRAAAEHAGDGTAIDRALDAIEQDLRAALD
jgi:hypothetical protein